MESNRYGRTGSGAGADGKRRGPYWGDRRSQGHATRLRRAASGGLGTGEGDAISESHASGDVMPGEWRVTAAGEDETSAQSISAA